MEAQAFTKYVRIAPRKVRLVIDAIRYKNAKQALYILASLKNRGARFVEKTLKSAIANAKFKKMDEALLYVSETRSDTGPTFKRFMARSMGRADKLLRRTTHITVKLKEREAKPASLKEKPKAPPAEAKLKTEEHSGKRTGKKLLKSKGA